MKKLLLHTIKEQQTHPIFIGSDILQKIEELVDMSIYGNIFIITDKQIEKVLLKNMPEFFCQKAHMIVLPFGERAKTIDTAEDIWKELLKENCDRSSLIVNIGGGVVCDVGGFAASTFMRGVDFINVPTTLLSQVDASVGGKTGINFENIKNIIGTFQQPKAVVIDVKTLETLPSRIFIEGFGEIIKHGLIADKKYFSFVTSKKPQDFSKDEMIEIIAQSCEIKAQIAEKDIEEKRERRLLNFGHTIGHALEAVTLQTENPLLHGEAVAIGMIAESYLSFFHGLLSKKELDIINKTIEDAGLPTKVRGVKKQDVLEKMLHDKKTSNKVLQWTLLEKIGKGVINKTVSEKHVEDAIGQVIEV